MPKRTSPNHPKLWRKSRGGKDYGCFYVTLDAKDVNLCTQNAERARIRMAEAVQGKRSWTSDATEAARAMEPTTEQLAAPAPAPEPDPPAPAAPAPGQVAAPAPPPSPVSSPPAAPLQLAPMSEENAKAEADATNAAAAGTGGAPDGGATTSDQPPAQPDAIFPPGGLDGFMEQIAEYIVIGQIELQAFLIRKRTGKIAAPIAPGSEIHKLAAQAWVEQFKRWYPDIGTVPPGVLAVGLPLIFMMPQMRGATDPPPTNGVHKPASPPEQPAEPPPIGSPIGVVS